MLNIASAQVAKSFGLPTHGYLIGSDAKMAGCASGPGEWRCRDPGRPRRINMISGAGMLDSLACHSAEKLVLDAESIAMAQRLLQASSHEQNRWPSNVRKGRRARRFLKIPETRKYFRMEQHLPSKVMTAARFIPGNNRENGMPLARARDR